MNESLKSYFFKHSHYKYVLSINCTRQQQKNCHTSQRFNVLLADFWALISKIQSRLFLRRLVFQLF